MGWFFDKSMPKMESTYIKKNAPYSSQWFSKFPARGGERSERSERSDQALLSISELFQTPSMFYLALHDRYKLNALPVPLLRQVYAGRVLRAKTLPRRFQDAFFFPSFFGCLFGSILASFSLPTCLQKSTKIH